MLRGLALGGLLVITAATAATGTAATTGVSVTAHVPLPAANSAEVVTFTATVIGMKGTPKAPTVHVSNDSAFGGATAVIAVGTPKKTGARATYTFAVFIHTFLYRRVLSGGGQAVDVGLVWSDGSSMKLSTLKERYTCDGLSEFDKAFEKGSVGTVRLGPGVVVTYVLESLRPRSVQDSPPEEVLDNVIALDWSSGAVGGGKCPGTAEGDDKGDS